MVELHEPAPGWRLIEAVERARNHPATFTIPTERDRLGLEIGHFAKIGYEVEDGPHQGHGERFWVEIEAIQPGGEGLRYIGRVRNDAFFEHGIRWDHRIAFAPRHILMIDDD